MSTPKKYIVHVTVYDGTLTKLCASINDNGVVVFNMEWDDDGISGISYGDVYAVWGEELTRDLEAEPLGDGEN